MKLTKPDLNTFWHQYRKPETHVGSMPDIFIIIAPRYLIYNNNNRANSNLLIIKQSDIDIP